MKRVCLFAFVLSCAIFSFSFAESSESVVGVSSNLLKSIGVGLVAGLFANLISWVTKKDTAGKQVQYDPNKGIPTFILGGFVGAFAGWAGAEVLSLAGFIGTVSTVYFVDNCWAAFYRNMIPVVKKLLNDIGIGK